MALRVVFWATVAFSVTSALQLHQPVAEGTKAVGDVLDSIKAIPQGMLPGADQTPAKVHVGEAKARAPAPQEAAAPREAVGAHSGGDLGATSAEAIEKLEAAKKAAIKREDYAEADRLKHEVAQLKARSENESVARQEAIDKLEAAKKAAIEREDYIEADRLKHELEVIKARKTPEAEGANAKVGENVSTASGNGKVEEKEAVPMTSVGKDVKSEEPKQKAYDVRELSPNHTSAEVVREGEKRMKDAKEALEAAAGVKPPIDLR